MGEWELWISVISEKRSEVEFRLECTFAASLKQIKINKRLMGILEETWKDKIC
jgi:hypothetical protein